MMPPNNDIQIFEHVPIEITPELDGVVVDFEVDYENVRANLTTAVETGRIALADLADFAKQAQSGRAYEVLAKVMASFVDANQKLIQIHETRKRLRGKVATSHTHNNLVITTSDLLKLIKKIPIDE